jgi:hypothetical protein
MIRFLRPVDGCKPSQKIFTENEKYQNGQPVFYLRYVKKEGRPVKLLITHEYLSRTESQVNISESPEGYACRTLRLLVDRMVA